MKRRQLSKRGRKWALELNIWILEVVNLSENWIFKCYIKVFFFLTIGLKLSERDIINYRKSKETPYEFFLQHSAHKLNFHRPGACTNTPFVPQDGVASLCHLQLTPGGVETPTKKQIVKGQVSSELDGKQWFMHPYHHQHEVPKRNYVRFINDKIGKTRKNIWQAFYRWDSCWSAKE